jgi:hypothetical protein
LENNFFELSLQRTRPMRGRLTQEKIGKYFPRFRGLASLENCVTEF